MSGISAADVIARTARSSVEIVTAAFNRFVVGVITALVHGLELAVVVHLIYLIILMAWVFSQTQPAGNNIGSLVGSNRKSWIMVQ
eukprot:2560788-Amphidinium_carterae.1